MKMLALKVEVCSICYRVLELCLHFESWSQNFDEIRDAKDILFGLDYL